MYILQEKIQEHITQSTSSSSEVSPHDVVGVVLGPKHPGHVRGLGMGVVPSFAFQHTTARINGMNLGSTNATTPTDRLDKMEETIQALCAYIRDKEGGNIPQQLTGIFPCTHEVKSISFVLLYVLVPLFLMH